MKKLIAALLTLSLMLCGIAACAEADADEPREVRCEIEDGSYVIHIPNESGDLGWIADDMTQDDSVVKLGRADFADGEFVVRYDPTGDGDMCVGVRHFTGIACDEAYTWDLSVRDGAVQECTGGSYTASPDASEFDPWIIGEWQADDGMAVMTIEKNPGGSAWDVEIAGAASRSGYVFKTTVYYDCELDSFVYDKGKYWNVPISDGEEAAELGEADIAGATGSFTLEGDESNLRMSWYDAQRPEETAAFSRAGVSESAGQDVAEHLLDTWVAEGFSAELWYDDDAEAYVCELVLNDGSFCDFSECTYDAEADALVCRGGRQFFATYNEETVDYDYDVVDTGITATFTLEGGLLTCEDSRGLLENVVFLHLFDSEDADAAAEASKVFEPADMYAAITAIYAEFSNWTGCEMHSFRYAGDEANNAENLEWLSGIKDRSYADCMEFLSDFHSPVEGGGAWEADTEYTDYQWWLAREDGGSWELVSWGY